MYDLILVPTDGSEAAERAMGAALDLAATFGSAVHLLHVIDSRRYDTSIESAVEPLERDGERYVERLAAMATEREPGLPVTTAIETGRPARTILQYVAEHGVDLVVVGTRGRGGLPRRLLGSVTAYVVTHATVPVHVVPSPAVATEDG
jgi:nucleotide-binding universal stress UspA family protein